MLPSAVLHDGLWRQEIVNVLAETIQHKSVIAIAVFVPLHAGRRSENEPLTALFPEWVCDWPSQRARFKRLGVDVLSMSQGERPRVWLQRVVCYPAWYPA